MKNYYEILGIAKTASQDEIKSSYRKQALKWHPDRNKTEEATAKFKEVTKAYEVLSDTKKKEMYDQYGHDAFDRGGFGGARGGAQEGPFSYTYSNQGGAQGNPFENVDFGGFSDPFEIFEQFFGFKSPFNGQQQQHRRNMYQIDLTFEEAVNGIEKEYTIEGKKKTVKIPAGVDDGTRMRFNEFDILFHVRPHAHFKRQGQDIYLEKDISYPDAILGTTIEVPTIHKKVKLKVRPGTKSGVAVRLRGEGIPHPQSSHKGDQYVIFNVHVPDKVSSKAKKLLEELQKEL